MNTLMAVETENFVLMERDVCLLMSVLVAPSDNAYRLQNQNILKGFRTPRRESASYVKASSSKLSRQKVTGQFIEEKVIVICIKRFTVISNDVFFLCL